MGLRRTRIYLGFSIAVLVAATASGCSTLGYYAQSIEGQYQVLEKRRPIEAVLTDPTTLPALKVKLANVLRAREFAFHDLGLPDNGSYSSYVDLQRRYVVWNVYAAPKLSLRPKTWCFPIAGCVDYRGYFEHQAAERYAAYLRRQGYDVYLGGVAAYSTLGWFRDPVLNTVLRGSNTDIAGLIFHELAHQELYIRGDTAFDESFAMSVEFEGMRRWLKANGDSTKLCQYQQGQERQQRVMALLLRYRNRLESLYASSEPDETKLEQKQKIFSDLHAAYARLRAQSRGYAGYDAWFSQKFDNASFVPIRLYNRYVPAFDALLRSVGGNLPAFYSRAKAISQLPPKERHHILASLANNKGATVAGNN